jgi:ParB-like chromosome segregation protein Spo0J
MLTIQYKKIDQLIPYARNSRTHSDAQVAQIAASIKEFGWTNPVLMDGDNGIIAGHGRVLAARKLGQTDIPTIELSHMTDTQKRAYIIADNNLALNAGWDEDLLALELKDIENLGFDLSIIGFDEAEINPKNNDDDVIVNDESRNLLMIELSSEQELQTIFDEMKERGFECKILS